jgi:hypothetical protein
MTMTFASLYKMKPALLCIVIFALNQEVKALSLWQAYEAATV